MSSDDDERTLCKYGVNCYQKNADHHKRFKHPKRKSEEDTESIQKKMKYDKEYKGIQKDEIVDIKIKQISYKKYNGRHVEKENEQNNQTSDEEKQEYNAESISKKPKHEKVTNERNENNAEDVKNKEKLNDGSHVIDISQFSDDLKLKIETVFLVKMPKDFFCFFDFCESLNKNCPQSALASVGLYLVGPFDLITQNISAIDQTAALRHYRYYYDPPEFQTLLKCDDKNSLHYGYFRDDPKEEPVFVASNEAKVSCKLNIISENLFSAVNIHINKTKKTVDPFKKIKIQKIQNALVDWSKKNGFSLDSVTKKMRDRRSKVVAKSFHSAGIVVPYNKKTDVGYRELKEDDATLQKMLKHLVEAETEEDRKLFWGKLQPVITYASIANDECDFGTGLELGLDLFCFGHEILHKVVLQVLTTSYNLLDRSEFSTILIAHLKNRNKENVCTIAS